MSDTLMSEPLGTSAERALCATRRTHQAGVVLGRPWGGGWNAPCTAVEVITTMGVVAGDEAPPAANVVGAVADAVAGVEAAKTEPGKLFGGRAALAPRRRAPRRLAARPTSISAAWLLVAVGVHRGAARDAVHLRAGAKAGGGGQPGGRRGGAAGRRRKDDVADGRSRRWGASDVAVGTRGSRAVRAGIGPAAVAGGDALAGEGAGG